MSVISQRGLGDLWEFVEVSRIKGRLADVRDGNKREGDGQMLELAQRVVGHTVVSMGSHEAGGSAQLLGRFAVNAPTCADRGGEGGGVAQVAAVDLG